MSIFWLYRSGHCIDDLSNRERERERERERLLDNTIRDRESENEREKQKERQLANPHKSFGSILGVKTWPLYR